MQRAASALSCVSAIAASVLVASVVPAAATEIEWNDSQIDLQFEAPANIALAALDHTAIEAKQDTPPDYRLLPYEFDRIVLNPEQAIVGIASFYDDPQETASGEQYNPNAFTAAAQLEIRGKFGGVQYGRLYRPAYGLGEYGGKKIIVRFNDVGPLKPGRKFDLSRAAMTYFDGTLDKGLLPGFRMTPLPLDRSYPEGPITDQELAALGIESDMTEIACAIIPEQPVPFTTASIPQPKSAATPRTEQSKPPVLRGKVKTIKTAAAARAAAKKKSKVAASRGVKPAPKKAVEQAPRETEQSPAWVKRLANWASSPAGEAPAQ